MLYSMCMYTGADLGRVHGQLKFQDEFKALEFKVVGDTGANLGFTKGSD